VHCPGCGTVKDVDLLKIDRHPGAPITSLIPELSCRNCRPHAPFARLKDCRAPDSTPIDLLRNRLFFF